MVYKVKLTEEPSFTSSQQQGSFANTLVLITLKVTYNIGTMKVVIVCLAFVAFTIAEPPVNNRYLPPQQNSRNGYNAPSQTYGAPNAGFGNGRSNGGFRSRPSSTYGAPSRSSPNNQYIPPRVANQYLPPSRLNQPTYQTNQISNRGTNQYQPSNQYQAPTSLYQAPTSLYQAPTSLYQAPTSQYQAPTNQYQAPSTQYGSPLESQAGLGVQYSAPSQQYGAPGLGGRSNVQISRGDFSSNSLAHSRQYLPPGRNGYDDGSNGEPANYNFEYMVKDDESGNDFGHRESRQGDRAEGLYYVLLPDGRKQTVEYEADQDGYKPRISYEDTGLGAGYSSRGQGVGGQGQYPEGPY